MRQPNPAIYAALAADIRDAFPDDDQLLADTLEGETDFHEAVAAVLEDLDRAEVFAEANKQMADRYAARKKLMDARQAKLRDTLMTLMGAADLRKLQLAAATVSVVATRPKAVFDGDPTQLPDDLRKVTIKPDLAALKAALSEGVAIPGATLTNGGETVSIRRA